ncbi:MAG: plasmid stabilization protein [Bacteroidetes bacterium RIFCSPLOWO2_02_FULL_36_8]|nr:MAG: plasmid stabilization protein [Bacteroidetes bacterium RIFCSPLOWO2_02_FULL_36_8]OFY70469.1 MAG: plasmid stabilization protein [Bacteroidetes bacterium RIFCSPLOWO2_12_FULL_37_12]
MEVSFSKPFKKIFKKRIKGIVNIEAEFWTRLEIFINDPFDSRLKTHKLSGNLEGKWSFRSGYDIRIVFFFTKDNPKKAVFIDIGKHDEVY